ncbi:hypothetical protein HanRHA438_Chr02g0068091 [Helianthus annuus]|nr:hypothetical protein HanRHA438_Chr02g0068091 [Helianthus annuus]
MFDGGCIIIIIFYFLYCLNIDYMLGCKEWLNILEWQTKKPTNQSAPCQSVKSV